MKNAIKPKTKWVTDEDVDYLKYALQLGNHSRQIKRALQDICGHYEANRKLQNPAEIRQLVHSHLHGDDVLARRWSFKALGLIGDPDDTSRIINQLKNENDREAQTWGTAALLRNARDRGIKEICAEANLEKDTSLVLAARLYAPDSWLNSKAESVSVSLQADDLTLKWAIFLAGYDRAPQDLFSPRYANEIFLGELNDHPSHDIREYSVWALWERPEYNVTQLKIAKEDVAKQPDSVKKWIYRLMLQSPHLNDFSPDVLADFRRDSSSSAREGLARGVVDLPDAIYNEELKDWLTQEKDQSVQEILLCSLAARHTDDEEITGLIKKRFKEDAPAGALRKKLLASAKISRLYPELKKIASEDAFAEYMLAHSNGGQFSLIPGGLVVKTGPTFNVGRDLNAQNIVGGDMLNSAHGAIQEMTIDNTADKEALEQVLNFIKSYNIPEDNRKEIISAVEVTAQKPTKENKENLLGTLKKIAEGTKLTGVVVAEAAKLVAILAGWAG